MQRAHAETLCGRQNSGELDLSLSFILFMYSNHRYARERAAEEPLGQASVGAVKPVVPEFPANKAAAAANPPRPNETPREIEVRSDGGTRMLFV